ncbi:hypothetical protein DMC30DRAFT_199261 [Rhodotorula diobovata]|uniref:Uncharacterized protein n=1 Tax=Rhodotorula diobovata TaxID=5288 RepID=A0A5C5G0J5_9BASI|nr:hypothetical protein DMC30DRAFT_199261 [Rhodotorula diobovata]
MSKSRSLHFPSTTKNSASMADSPRRNTQANRQARRAQPYARPAPVPEPQGTPSRLRSLLSYVSPFRSARKPKEPSPEPADAAAVSEDEDAGMDNGRVKDEHDSADEDAQFALHGKLMTRAGDFNQNAPPSPSPGTGSSTQRSLGSSLASSATMPNLAALGAAPSTSSGLATPRFPGALRRSPSRAHYADAQSAYTAESAAASSSSHATQELARFFQAKAERGEDRLSAVEQAGVFQLMQRAQEESALPTAFTPNFRSIQPSFLSQPASQVPSSSASSVFGGAAPSIAGSAIPPTATKRRRPIYVGAGYSSRRRRTALGSGLASTQIESALSSLAGGPSSGNNADGKRRRTGANDEDEDDIPVATLDDIVASPARTAAAVPASPARSFVASPAPASKPKAPAPAALSKIAGAGTGASTPAKPSPLWQVSSQSEAATPSPPRKAPATTTSTAGAGASPASATRAADLVLEVIRQEDEARQKALPQPAAAPASVRGNKDAILNPYAGEENPLALAGRVARKDKAKPASPKPKERVSKVVAEVEKLKEKEISPLEQLERTMPAEYRRDTKRSKQASPPPAPKPAPAKAKAKAAAKPVAVVTLSSSDNEDEDEEMGSGDNEEHEDEGEEDEEEEEEEDQLDEDEDEAEQDDDEPLPAPSSAFSFGKPSQPAKSAFTFGSSSSQPQPASTSTSTSPFSFGSSTAAKPAFSFAPAPAAPASAAAAPAPEPTSDGAHALLALSGGDATRPLTPQEAHIPPKPPVFPPSSSATAKPDAVADESDPKATARTLPKAQLPLARFSFAGVGGGGAARQETDKAREAVKELAKAMGKGELPTFAF